jgi:flagellar protein FliO/FliZ
MLFLRFGVAMIVVMGLLFFASSMLRKRGLMNPKSKAAGPNIELVARKGLGRNVQVAVVRTAGHQFVLGVTEHQVTLLAEEELSDIASLDAIESFDSFEDLYESTEVITTPSGGHRTSASNGAQQFATPGQAWKTLLDGLRDRTVRR